MEEEMFISENKIEKLSKKVSKTLSLSEEEALSVIYEEWDIVENLFHANGKVKAVHTHFIEEINDSYRIA